MQETFSVATVDIEKTEGSQPLNEYAELKKRIKEKGLLNKQPNYYLYKIVGTIVAVLIGLIVLFSINTLWVQIVDAAYLAVVLAQAGFLGHDAGHRQIFNSAWKNELTGLFFGNLLVGMSNTWWIGKHNEHHSHPNEIDMDPDLNIPFLCFTAQDAHESRGLARFIMHYQAYLFFPMLFFVAVDMKRVSIQFLFQERKHIKYFLAEALLIGTHLVLPVALLLWRLGFWPTLLFLVINQGMLGFILGSAFAPNHKGMPMLAKGTKLDFLHKQVLTARNIRASWFADFWYGGLNYQIEHHLFPSMPRNKLGQAQAIIKAYCAERSISFAETSIFGSYGAILHILHGVSRADKLVGSSGR
jgi:fatty acid desaturase